MAAQLLRTIAALLLAVSLGWLAAFARFGGWWPLLAPLLMAVGWAGFLGAEFLALAWLRRGDPTPRASCLMLGRAWMLEAVLSPRVFLWRQAFAAEQLPDILGGEPARPPRRGVILLSGLFCNRGFWNPWLIRLRAEQRPFMALNLEPLFGSIDTHVTQIEKAVTQLTAATGMAPVLVCHSMGGLAARAWLRGTAGDARVKHVFTIATPHRGTWLAHFSSFTRGREMAPGCRWLTRLAEAESPARRALFTCWYSNCDNVVIPPTNATMAGARNRLVPGYPHVTLAYSKKVMEATLAAIACDRYGERDGPG